MWAKFFSWSMICKGFSNGNEIRKVSDYWNDFMSFSFTFLSFFGSWHHPWFFWFRLHNVIFVRWKTVHTQTSICSSSPPPLLPFTFVLTCVVLLFPSWISKPFLLCFFVLLFRRLGLCYPSFVPRSPSPGPWSDPSTINTMWVIFPSISIFI